RSQEPPQVVRLLAEAFSSLGPKGAEGLDPERERGTFAFVTPNARHPAVHEDRGGKPALRAIHFLVMFPIHQVSLVFQAEQESIEERQESDMRRFERRPM